MTPTDPFIVLAYINLVYTKPLSCSAVSTVFLFLVESRVPTALDLILIYFRVFGSVDRVHCTAGIYIDYRSLQGGTMESVANGLLMHHVPLTCHQGVGIRLDLAVHKSSWWVHSEWWIQRLYRSLGPLGVGPVGNQSLHGGADACQINGIHQNSGRLCVSTVESQYETTG